MLTLTQEILIWNQINERAHLGYYEDPFFCSVGSFKKHKKTLLQVLNVSDLLRTQS
jgi:hypothetical protein